MRSIVVFACCPAGTSGHASDISSRMLRQLGTFPSSFAFIDFAAIFRRPRVAALAVFMCTLPNTSSILRRIEFPSCSTKMEKFVSEINKKRSK